MTTDYNVVLALREMSELRSELKNAKDYIDESDRACQSTLKDLGLTWNHLGIPTAVERLAREIKTLRAASYRSHTSDDAR